MKYDEKDKERILRAMSDNRLLRMVARIMRNEEKAFTLADIERELRRRVASRKGLNGRDKNGTPD